VALSALIYGPVAGAIATFLGVLAAIYIWIPPKYSFAMPSPSDCATIGLFVLASSIILWATALSRARQNASNMAKDVLDLGLEAGGVGIWEIDLRTRRISASSAAYRLHGLPETMRETKADDWMRGIPPDDAAQAVAAIQEAIGKGTVADYTYRINSAEQSPRWVSARGRVVSSGGVKRLLCALVDVTEQVKAQDELKRERERLRLALEAGALAVWDLDPATGHVEIDARYAATMGFAPDAKTLTLEQIGARLHPEDLLRVGEEHEALMGSGADYRIEFRIITPAGDIRWLVSQGIMIGGRIPFHKGRLIGILQDITDRKRREEDLQNLASARELLVREADHRIKNSLQMVISLLSVQLRGVEDKDAANALREAITRVGAIAACHLALQGSEDLKQVDFSVTLKELCGHFAQLNPAITIVCRPVEALMLDADRAIPLGLAVSEVVTNALRHAFSGRETGRVTVEALTLSCGLTVRVSDDGVGMPQEAASAGLGSRIIRALAAQLSAAVEVDSAPQTGTIVTLRMPLTQASV